MVKYVKALGSAPARLLRRARLWRLWAARHPKRQLTHWAPSHCASGARRGLEPAASTGRPCRRPLAMHSGAASERFKLPLKQRGCEVGAPVLKGSIERGATRARTPHWWRAPRRIAPRARGGRAVPPCGLLLLLCGAALYLLLICCVGHVYRRKGGGKGGCVWLWIHRFTLMGLASGSGSMT